MKKNVGGIDRVIRLVLTLVIFGAGYYFKSWWGLLGLVPLLTGAFSYCGLYSLIGVSTCKVKTPPSAPAVPPISPEPPKQP